MALSGESIDSWKDVGLGLVPGLDDRFIGKVDSRSVMVEVVAVVVSNMNEYEVFVIQDSIGLKSCGCAHLLMVIL